MFVDIYFCHRLTFSMVMENKMGKIGKLLAQRIRLFLTGAGGDPYFPSPIMLCINRSDWLYSNVSAQFRVYKPAYFRSTQQAYVILGEF